MIHSLRARLILTFTLIFGAIQLVLGVIALTARESYIEGYFDEQLMRRADSIASRMIRIPGPFTSTELSDILGEDHHTGFFRDFYIQVTDAQGNLLGRSQELGRYRLPVKAEAIEMARLGKRQLETLAGEAVESVAGPATQLRMVTLYMRPPAKDPIVVQVATSTQHVDDSKDFLRGMFLIGIPIGLLAAAVASWFAADRAIHTIQDIKQLAAQTTPEHLDHRVDASSMAGELGDMAKHINQMLDRLEAGFNAQQRFIHDASHELKTPVSVLLSEAQVLEMSRPDEADYQKFVRSVQQEMHRLGRLVESLLLIARSDGRSLVTMHHLESVNDLAVEAVARNMAMAEQHQIKLCIELPMPEDVPDGVTIRGDADLCDAMIGNLIRNAIKYSPARTTVWVKVKPKGEKVEVQIIDQGPSIPPQEKEKIFKRFVRGSTSGPRLGTGLGLAIARSVAELHGGSISLWDGPDGVGCVFCVTLPLERRASQGSSQNQEGQLAAIAADGSENT
jgi:two-component system OmpR family sensor kinase